MINKESLRALEPCKDRFDNYLSHYDDFEGSLKQFFNLKKISFSDKAWVYFRFIDKEKSVLVATALAEACLPIFEAKYPSDKRPHLAIEAAKTGKVTKEILDGAYYAANAAHAVYYAAGAAYYAANAAAYAAGADHAHAAYTAAYYAAEVIDEEPTLKIMKEFI